jgi:hypothetical protein
MITNKAKQIRWAKMKAKLKELLDGHPVTVIEGELIAH